MAMMNQVRDIYEQALDNLSADERLRDAQERIRSGANQVYDAARSNPRMMAGILIGAGLAAAAYWILSEPRRLAAMKRRITQLGHRTAARRTRRAA
jgi:hypothetical protein